MNRREYLMMVLGEEGSEINQMASKNNRFGMKEIFPDQPLTNAERLHLEIDDLMAMVEMLNDEFDLGYKPSRVNIEAKKRKVNKYYQYSVSLGLAGDESLKQVADEYNEWILFSDAGNGDYQCFLKNKGLL